MHRPSLAARGLVAVSALLLVGTACAGKTAPHVASPTPTASSASLAPTPPASSTPGTTVLPGTLSAWTGCSGGFQCATLTVNLDDAHPERGTVPLSLTRRKATSSPRLGSLLVNPGGPGGSAVDFAHDSYTDFPAPLRQHFDIVAFDPRGVGHTAPVRCATTAELDTYFHIDPTPDTPAELATLDAANAKLDKGCETRSKRILPYVSTAIVADDMERVRLAVGDPKLTYLGYSYGTAIGAAYLDKYPTHVRAMVLDGALDPRLTWDQLLAGQSRGFDVAFNSFINDCQRTNCPFRQAVQGDLFKAYDALLAKVEQHPLPGDATRTVGPGEFTLGVAAGLYSRSNGWPAIAAALAAAVNGQGDALLSLNDSYLERSDSGYSNITEANISVNCIDRPWPRTDAPYQALAKQVAATAPRFGPAIALSGLGCAVWPLPPVGHPHPVVAAASPPIVVLGNTRDPATPYAWAQGLSSQLAHAVLLTHVGDGHTVYRTGAPACIVNPVNDYLISLKVPTRATC